MWPWLDRGGRFSPLKSIVFALLFAPGLWLAWRLAAGQLGPRPINEIILHTGLWTIRLLLITLVITPLRQLLRWPQLVTVRRMIGVAAFAYGAAHLTAFAADKVFDLGVVATEIVTRFYLTIGALALAGLAALAVTSTDRMVRRLGGRNWRRLHRLVYAIGILGAVHFFLQSKLNVAEPIVMAGLLTWLLGYRLLPDAVGQPLRRLAQIAGLGILVGFLTLVGEFAYYWLAFHADPLRLLAATFSLKAGIRPGWIVLAIGALATAAGALRLPSAARGGLLARRA
ncbi:MAG TPA: protein-methionine-sulfoxide reductase heme-binding subunit MsrQ [Candidatus Angelobacter sp.]|nr:protein-methionine-sulfoxide reductase heme-binding subunit MsrQ [Candidatus Angelobacter sp.]